MLVGTPHPHVMSMQLKTRASTRANLALAYRFSMLGAFVFVAALTTSCRQCGGDVTAPEAARTSAPEGQAPSAATSPTPVAAVAPASAPVGGWPNARSSLGTNLSGVSDWGSEIPFIDAFRASRELTSGSPTAWGDDRKLDIDARDRKSTRLNSSHTSVSRMPSSA